MEDDHAAQQQALADGNLPPIGSRWKDFRGTVYTVVLVSVREATGITLVSYQSEESRTKGELPWTRSLLTWRSLVSPVDV